MCIAHGIRIEKLCIFTTEITTEMINIIKIVLTKLDDAKRRVIQATRYGNDDTVEFVNVAPFGIDSNPVKDIPALSVRTVQGTYTIGVVRGENGSEVGETWLYSTDDKGVIKSVLKLRNDGTIEVNGADDNAVLYSKLEKAFNDLRSDFNSLVNTYNGHTHAGSAGSVPVTITPTPNQGTPSSADITPAKSSKVKLS